MKSVWLVELGGSDVYCGAGTAEGADSARRGRAEGDHMKDTQGILSGGSLIPYQPAGWILVRRKRLDNFRAEYTVDFEDETPQARMEIHIGAELQRGCDELEFAREMIKILAFGRFAARLDRWTPPGWRE